VDPSTRGSDAIGGLAAALLAAGVLVAGPGVAVAVGDPGPRHSHSRDGRDSSERDGRGGREGGKSQRDARDGRDRSERGESERGDPGRDQRRGNRDHDDSASGDRQPEGEWVPSDPSDVPIPEAFAPEPAVQTPTARVAARVPAAGETPQSPSVSAGDTDESDGGGGGGGASQAAGSFVSPRVVVGNGRVPGEGSIDRVEPPVVPAPTIPSNVEPPAPVVTPAQPPSAPPPPAPISPVDQSSEAAPPLMTAPPTTGGISAMWGLAGLLLAPLAGIWLGYRQARATKAADQLTTSLAGG
jgi:hypothetical protein